VNRVCVCVCVCVCLTVHSQHGRITIIIILIYGIYTDEPKHSDPDINMRLWICSPVADYNVVAHQCVCVCVCVCVCKTAVMWKPTVTIDQRSTALHNHSDMM